MELLCVFTMEPRSEDVAWELDEGIPQFEDPFIQQYLRGRQALIEEEQKQRHGMLLAYTNRPTVQE